MVSSVREENKILGRAHVPLYNLIYAYRVFVFFARKKHKYYILA